MAAASIHCRNPKQFCSELIERLLNAKDYTLPLDDLPLSFKGKTGRGLQLAIQQYPYFRVLVGPRESKLFPAVVLREEYREEFINRLRPKPVEHTSVPVHSLDESAPVPPKSTSVTAAHATSSGGVVRACHTLAEFYDGLEEVLNGTPGQIIALEDLKLSFQQRSGRSLQVDVQGCPERFKLHQARSREHPRVPAVELIQTRAPATATASSAPKAAPAPHTDLTTGASEDLASAMSKLAIAGPKQAAAAADTHTSSLQASNAAIKSSAGPMKAPQWRYEDLNAYFEKPRDSVSSTAVPLLSAPVDDLTCGLLGQVMLPLDTSAAAHGMGEEAKPEHVWLKTSEPFCLVAVGVQGFGKSHTMNVVMENCILPNATDSGHPIQLQTSMTCLVLHYDSVAPATCEAMGLLKSSRSGCKVPLNAAVVLVSPYNYPLMKEAYVREHPGCKVVPLLFSWDKLNARQLRDIMNVDESDNQLYMAVVMNLLQGYQRDGKKPTYAQFKKQLAEVLVDNKQTGPLQQRLRLLESLLIETEDNKKHAQGLIQQYLQEKQLIIVDLHDPYISSTMANSVFRILLEQFRSCHIERGKLVVLDEAHRYMQGDSKSTLGDGIVDTVRLMRHQGIRVAISSQSPVVLAPELLELVTVAVLHRFHAKDWFDFLSKKLPLTAEHYDAITKLDRGVGMVFATGHNLTTTNERVFKMRIRQRLTYDEGASKKHS